MLLTTTLYNKSWANMKTEDIIFGGASLLSLALSFQFSDPVYQTASVLASFLLLITMYLSVNMRRIKQMAESTNLEVKKITEKMRLYERLADIEARMKRLEVVSKR